MDRSTFKVILFTLFIIFIGRYDQDGKMLKWAIYYHIHDVRCTMYVYFIPYLIPLSTVQEHFLLPPCDNVPVVVYDEEPSSLIAYSLRYINQANLIQI